VIDTSCTYVEDCVEVGAGTVLHPNVYLQGSTKVGDKCELFGSTRVVDSVIGDNCLVESSTIKDSEIANHCEIGPNSHLRGGNVIGKGCVIGNFVEVKKSTLGSNVKVKHLSYLGDAEVGENTNVGAGSYTCNYDGIKKHKTTIGKNVFIGSNAKFVAPVVVKDGSVIGAGSVITDEVSENSLAIARSRQTVKEGWATENWHNRKK